MEIHSESFGSGGTPLIVAPGGFGLISMHASLIEALAAGRRVVGIELQGHGHTPDVERPFSYEAFGDDIAELTRRLELGRVDLLGYSLGAGACLRAAIQHPELVRRLVVTSFPFSHGGWFPEVREQFERMSSAAFGMMRHSPMYGAYEQVAPDPAAFPTLMDKVGELQRRRYDWSEEVRALQAQTMLVYADADAIAPSHVAEFYALLGGGLRDAGWDRSQRPPARLAVLPGLTHYDVFDSPLLVSVVSEFLDG